MDGKLAEFTTPKPYVPANDWNGRAQNTKKFLTDSKSHFMSGWGKMSKNIGEKSKDLKEKTMEKEWAQKVASKFAKKEEMKDEDKKDDGEREDK